MREEVDRRMQEERKTYQMIGVYISQAQYLLGLYNVLHVNPLALVRVGVAHIERQLVELVLAHLASGREKEREEEGLCSNVNVM